MPPANRKPSKPRRTHNLGGCATCRRRHVKCDQARPQCNVCRSAKLECTYPSPIRWASLATGPTSGKHRAAPKENSGKKSSTAEGDDLQQGEGPCPDRGGAVTVERQQFRIIPDQSVPNLRASDFEEHNHGASMVSPPIASGHELTFDVNEHRPLSSDTIDPMVDWNWLFDVSSGLGWNDLFDSGASLSMSAITDPMLEEQLEIGSNEYVQNQQQVLPPDNLTDQPGSFRDPQWQENAFHPEVIPSDPPPSYTASSVISEADVLEDAKVLLKHFREVVIPRFSPVPMASKSPWEIMHWRAAVQTHADMTFLESSHITHASKANFFAVLGCSAYTMIRVQTNVEGLRSAQRLPLVLDYSGKRAKSEMQESLQSEVTGVKKAKYKDQLMGILSLIALETLMGMPANARCYLIDAERLLRLRGLAKREVSRRARLLHHVYTWLRIIGESTFVLHNHKNSALQTRIENMLSKEAEAMSLSPSSDRSKNTRGEYSELDDFLRIETRAADSDSDLDTSKDDDTGLRDIHLADVRQWSQTMYMEVYGIPEIWLSLVSQVTRIANFMDALENTSIPLPQAMDSSLQRKLNRLEQKICSFAAQHSAINALSSDNEDEGQPPSLSTPSKSHQAMLRAMSSALVIFFYRRIRKVHPWILQAHVNDVITALKDFSKPRESSNSTPGIIGTPWPAFIAGCEAMSPESRQWLLTWIENAACQSRSSGFLNCQQVMQQVWLERDEASKSGKSGNKNRGKEDRICTWMDVLKQQKLWLMLY